MRYPTVLIGFGRVAASLAGDARMMRWFPKATHLQCLADHPKLELVGIADRSEEARAAARQMCPAAKVTAEARDLAKLSPSVAVLAIPPAGRLAALAALPSVRAVVLEKPLGAAEARLPMAALCREKAIVAQVNYWRRGDPALRALAGGRHGLGRPQAAFALYGNGLRNNGSHMIDLIRMLIGENAAVRATSAYVTDPRFPLAGDGALSFVLELANGMQASVQPLDFQHYRENALDIWGERGRLAIEQEGLLIRRFPRRPHRGLGDAEEIACDAAEEIPIRAGEAMPALYDNLAEALERAVPLLSPLSSALETERVLDALIASASAGGARIEMAGRA